MKKIYPHHTQQPSSRLSAGFAVNFLPQGRIPQKNSVALPTCKLQKGLGF